MRAGMAKMRAAIPPPLHPDVKESTLHFNARDGHELRALLFSPVGEAGKAATVAVGEGLGKGGGEKRPGLFVFFHGGGGSIGEPEEGQSLLRLLVSSLGVVAVSMEYRLAPEWQWPKGTEDAWDGVRWCAQHASQVLDADLSRGFVVGGVSNGANLRAVVSHLARDEGLTLPVTGVAFLAGSTVTEDAVPERYRDQYLSRQQPECLDAPPLDRKTKKLFDVCMPRDGQNPLYSVLNWETGHKGLPRCYLQACGMDIGRDDVLIYEQALKEEGRVDTMIDIYSGMPHIFWQVFGMLAQGRKWKVDVVRGIGWLFGVQMPVNFGKDSLLTRVSRALTMWLFMRCAEFGLLSYLLALRRTNGRQ